MLTVRIPELGELTVRLDTLTYDKGLFTCNATTTVPLHAPKSLGRRTMSTSTDGFMSCPIPSMALPRPATISHLSVKSVE